MRNINLGKAVVRPRTGIVTGSFQTLTYTYTAGHSIDDSGYLMIAFRVVGDFGKPQFEDPKAPNFCSVHTNGDCRLVPRWDPKGNTRPWSKALYIMVTGGFLDEGEKITVVFGDSSHGSPGWQMQTFCEHTFEFKTYVDPIATYQFKELPQSPEVRIVPGKPVRAVCIAPSRVVAGEKFSYHLKLEDAWGNPTNKPRKYVHPCFPMPGLKRVYKKTPKSGFSAWSNPIQVTSGRPSLIPCWADFHGQSEETIGANSIDDYFTFARDYGLLDICAHQGNDFQVTDDFWDRINRATRKYYTPGSFVTFPGYEWSGNTPLGGDRNVFFKEEWASISRSSCEQLPGGKSKFKDAPTADQLFGRLRKNRGKGPFVFAHVGGRFADMGMHDPALEVAIEIHSAWGTFEWLLEEAFDQGYRVGICANSDGHKTRPGASYPGAGEFGSYGGLTCVLAKGLDRENIYRAIMARHFYATTGHRPILDLSLVTGDGGTAMMGDILTSEEKNALLKVNIAGTGPLERVDIRNGCKTIRSFYPFSTSNLGNRIKVIWSGAEVRGRARMTRWDGSLRVNSNRILSMTPINFWSPIQPIQRKGNTVQWKSMTTGGHSGVILTLEKMHAGSLVLKTAQGSTRVDIGSIGPGPRTRKYGGLNKQIQISRLPAVNTVRSFECQLPIKHLQKGDNPIYVRAYQEDGHIAWSSPIYLVK